jgi:alpha-beta hydrolase superfamily lysophospholipase
MAGGFPIRKSIIGSEIYMDHRELSWTTDDGLKLYGQEWNPSEAIKGVIVLVHGLGEHSGRYNHVGAAFTAAGYQVVSFDFPGHGKSGGKRGYGSYDIYAKAIDLVLRSVRQERPPVPAFLYGHSLGASLVIYYLIKYQPKLDGAIASGPAFASGFPVPPVKIFAGRIMKALAPNTIFSNGLPQSGLSHDPIIQPSYVADPLVHDHISARLGIELLDCGPWLILQASKIHVPLYVIYGSEDPIISRPKIIEFTARCPEVCTPKVWEGMYHEVHNEIGKEQVLADLISWCDQRVNHSALA